MKSDSAWIPGEGVIVVAQTVPACIKRRAIAAQRSWRRAEFSSRVVLDHLESGAPGQLRTLVDIPISGGRTIVGKAFHASVLQVEAASAGKAVRLGEHCLVDQPLGERWIRRIQTPHRID